MASDPDRPGLAAELEAVEGRFRGIIDAMADAVVVVGDDGVVRFANAAAGHLFARPRRELEGEPFGFPLSAGAITEVEIHPREQGYRLAEMRVVESEWNGEPVLLASLRDITDRKRLEELRAEQAENRAKRVEAELATRRMQLLADAGALLASSLTLGGPLERLVRILVPRLADWCLVVLDRDSVDTGRRSAFSTHADPAREAALKDLVPLYRSDKAREIFDPDPELVIDGEAWLAARDEDARRRFSAVGLTSAIHLPMVINDRTVGCMTLARTGEELPPSAFAGKVYDASDLTLARELGRRVTLALDSARLYRQAERASRMRDEFMAKVSHEMRTPLQAILGWTSILRQDGRLAEAGDGDADRGNDRLRRAIEVIERNAESQVHLIEDILDVSRIITGKLSLERETVAARRIVAGAIESLIPAAEEKDIQISGPDADDDVDPVLIHADPHRLQQVVTNLVSNSIKYTPNGGHVEISLLRRDDQPEVTIRVRDDGKGIPEDVLPYIFNPFRQGDRPQRDTETSSGGLGLGLAIVHQLVQMHGGEVSAESDGEGRGATFEVHLPTGDAAESSQARKPLLDSPDTGPGGHDLSGTTLAVVDDEEDARELLETALSDLGARVWTASSRQDFFRRLESEVAADRLPDVVISDVGMPDGDGYGLIQELRKRPAEEGGQTPAVALTGYARPEDQGRALDSGFQRHLAKPVSLAHLADVVAELIGQGADAVDE